MKLLVVDDGSIGARAAIETLSRAGLPNRGKAMIASVAAAGTPAPDAGIRIRSQLPGWEFYSEELKGPPEDEILKTSFWWNPDLLILGSNSEVNPSDRMIQNPLDVVHHARCSVRVVRPLMPAPKGPVRLIIGNDGSKEAQDVIAAVARRSWPADTEAKIIWVIEGPSKDLMSQLSSSDQTLVDQLCAAGLKAQGSILEGDPGKELAREAERWNADAIFLGAGGASRIDRFLLGGVSTAVVTRARRPVEIVRS